MSHNSGKVKMNTTILASGLILIIFAKLFIQQVFIEYLVGTKQYSVYSPLCLELRDELVRWIISTDKYVIIALQYVL